MISQLLVSFGSEARAPLSRQSRSGFLRGWDVGGRASVGWVALDLVAAFSVDGRGISLPFFG